MKSEMERVLRPKEAARKNYNSLSHWYDLFTSSEKRITNVGIRMLDLQPNESVLEIGCGTGHELIEFAKMIQGGRIIAVDISEEMIKLARRRFQKKVPKRSVWLCQGDGAFLPFHNERFDAIFLSFTLELFDTPEIQQVLSECHRVLRSDGRIGVVALEKQETISVCIYEWFHNLLPGLVDCRPIYLKHIVKEAYFSIQQSATEMMWGLPVEIVIASK